MRAFPHLLCTTLVLGVAAAAQARQATPAPKQDSDQAVANSGMTITVRSQLVQVDVVVHDANGRGVHGLKPSDFQLAEDKKTQTLRNFEEHVAVDPAHARPPAVVKLGPGIFTDYSAVPEDAPLTVILVDRLNTPVSAQAYVLQQLRKFIKSADPNSRVAIFGLTSRLIMLQGFTSDPAVLRAVVDHKIGTQSSVILPEAGVDQNLSDAAAEAGAPASAVAGLQQFEAESGSYQQQLGINLTLTAFNQLAGYLAGFLGRKNLLWLSGSFPISIDPVTLPRSVFFRHRGQFFRRVHKDDRPAGPTRVSRCIPSMPTVWKQVPHLAPRIWAMPPLPMIPATRFRTSAPRETKRTLCTRP